MEYMYAVVITSGQVARAELFRLLGDAHRLRLLALCAEEELTVGELAALLHESQPQVTKKSQPLRDAGLLLARRDGARTLLRAAPTGDQVVVAALEEGRALCAREGRLARVGAIVAQREELSRRYFATPPAAGATRSEPGVTPSSLAHLRIFAALLPGRQLAVDLGTGEGALLPLLSPIYDRVIAVDRSPARLARCAARSAALGLPNVRLREGDADDPALAQEIAEKGGADLVVLARVLHHAARPHETVAAAARLLRPGGHLAVVDYLPHDDEDLRGEGDVWLGFEPKKLQSFAAAARLAAVAMGPLPALAATAPTAVPGDAGANLPLHFLIAHKPLAKTPKVSPSN